jgi:hypothetical protein
MPLARRLGFSLAMLASVVPLLLPAGRPRGFGFLALAVMVVLLGRPFESASSLAFCVLGVVACVLVAIADFTSSWSWYFTVPVYVLIVVAFVIEAWPRLLDKHGAAGKPRPHD